MTAELIETTYLVPMPAVAGWTEEKRLAEMANLREQAVAAGGRIAKERRVRNIAFDGRGEKTSWEFVVEWSGEEPTDGRD